MKKWGELTTRGMLTLPLMGIGGDEVNTACYESTPSIAAWLKAKGLKDGVCTQRLSASAAV